MPTYEYVCNSCAYEFELFQPITAPVKRKCPECGNLKLERLIGTGAGVIFKGSGFYQTDYRSESYNKDAKADKDRAAGKSGNAKDNGKDKTAKTRENGSESGKSKSTDSQPAAATDKKNKSQSGKSTVK